MKRCFIQEPEHISLILLLGIDLNVIVFACSKIFMFDWFPGISYWLLADWEIGRAEKTISARYC